MHHLTYERLGCEWLTDLVALCKDCHEQEHDDEFKTMFARLLEMSDEEVRELMHLPQSH